MILFIDYKLLFKLYCYLSVSLFSYRIIYPHSHADMIRNNRTDEELMDILRSVHLENIPKREGGWETKKEWKDVFSGGEKQRVNINLFLSFFFT